MLPLTIHKNTRRQIAADDAADIADAIDALGNMLDRFYEQHGRDLGDRLIDMMPMQPADIGPAAARKIAAFARSLEPIED